MVNIGRDGGVYIASIHRQGYRVLYTQYYKTYRGVFIVSIIVWDSNIMGSDRGV
jgi:hypothetical protein